MAFYSKKQSCLIFAIVAFGAAQYATAADFKISGQVNRAMTYADNGKKSDVGFFDGVGKYSTRFRFTGSEKISDTLSVGFLYEIGITDRTSTEWDIKKNAPTRGSTAAVDNRWAAVYLNGRFGRLTFGKLGTASWGSSTVDYSGTSDQGGGSSQWFYGNSITYTTKDSINGSYASGITTRNVIDNFNGLARENGIVYGTPSVNGFSVKMGTYTGNAFDVVPRYDLDFGDGGKFSVALSYLDTHSLNRIEQPDGTVERSRRYKEYGGSTALLLPSGFNAAVTYKRRSYDFGTDPTAYYFQVGYRSGKHNTSLGYGWTKDALMKDTDEVMVKNIGTIDAGTKSRGDVIALSYVYNMTPSIDLYASYHRYGMRSIRTLDHGNVRFHDINQLYAGVTVRLF